MLERLLRGAAIRRVIRIGDGEAGYVALRQRGSQPLQALIHFYGRPFRCEHDDPADGVERSGIHSPSLGRQLVHVILVGGHEHLKRRAFADLTEKIAG